MSVMASYTTLLHRTAFFFITVVVMTVGPMANVAPGAQDTPAIDSGPARENPSGQSVPGTGENPPPRHLITAIRIEAGSPSEERIIFSLEGKPLPKMFFIDGDPVRLVCDFLNAEIGAGVGQEIEARGKFIRRLRIGIHESPQQKVRVVIELISGQDYEIDEYFRPEESSYELFVRPAAGMGPSGKS